MFLPFPALRRSVLLALLLPALLLGPVPAPATPAAQSAPLHRLTDPVPDPQAADVQWFAPTGHTLRGAFLAYWTRYGGLAQFGYPLTEAFTESNDPDGKNPLLVQYFERTRFESHPENAGSLYAVLLGPLGRAFHAADPPVPAPTDPAIRYFPETGHTLRGAFRQYWETHGGLFVHGYPLTEPFQEQNPTDGQTYTVQYFERSRFEHHPENVGSPYEVLLGLLGEQVARMKGYFDGRYPHYGRAADFSWLAGQIAPPKLCIAPECTCLRFYYGEPEKLAAPLGPGLVAAPRDLVRHSIALVMFGHLAAPSEQDSVCQPSYVVDYVQANPTP